MTFNHRRVFFIAAFLAFLPGLGACVVEPLGGGHEGGGHEHEDRNRDDHDGEHRHDFGVNQRGNLGLSQPDAMLEGNPVARSAVFLPENMPRRHAPLWA